MDTAEFKQQFLPYHPETLPGSLPADGQPSGCGRYGAGSVSEIVEQAR